MHIQSEMSEVAAGQKLSFFMPTRSGEVRGSVCSGLCVDVLSCVSHVSNFRVNEGHV